MNEQRTYLHLMVNHAAIASIVTILMHCVYHFSAAIVANQVLLDSLVMPHGFEVNPHYGTWNANRSAIVYAYGAGPAMCLFLATIAKLVHSIYYSRQRNDVKIFLYWIYLTGLNYVIGGALVGVVTQRGFGHAILYGSQAGVAVRVVIAFVALLLCILLGTRSMRYFLEFAPNEDLTLLDNKKTRLTYLFTVVAVPWLVSSLALLAFTLPSPHMIWSLSVATMLLILFPVMSFFRLNVRFFLSPDPLETRLNWLYVIGALGVYLILKIVLSGGIAFEVA